MESNVKSTPKHKGGVVKVLLAEDHKITAKLITAIIEHSGTCKIVGIAENGREVIEMARNSELDIIIMDINMPFVDGISAMEEIFSFHKDIKIIVLSSHTEAWIIKKSINVGASGYVTKMTDLDSIIEAIMTVYNGGAYLDPISMNLLVDDYEPQNATVK